MRQASKAVSKGRQVKATRGRRKHFKRITADSAFERANCPSVNGLDVNWGSCSKKRGTDSFLLKKKMKRKKNSSGKKENNNYTQSLAIKIRTIVHNFQHFFSFFLESSVKFNGLNVVLDDNFY